MFEVVGAVAGGIQLAEQGQGLDIECLDRVYLNAYVPILQSSGQVVAFMTQYLDTPLTGCWVW